jgi:hypothetical protein
MGVNGMQAGSGYAVFGSQAGVGAGIYGESTAGYGAIFSSGSGVQLKLQPSSAANPPPGQAGELFVDSLGLLRYHNGHDWFYFQLVKP